MKFKNMEVGDCFLAWGDRIANYDYPKDCFFEKINDTSATEILDFFGEQTHGISVLVDPEEDFPLTTDT